MTFREKLIVAACVFTLVFFHFLNVGRIMALNDRIVALESAK